ncbi:MAG: hypothetical protein RSD22_09740 [Romboutsia sp.]
MCRLFSEICINEMLERIEKDDTFYNFFINRYLNPNYEDYYMMAENDKRLKNIVETIVDTHNIALISVSDYNYLANLIDKSDDFFLDKCPGGELNWCNNSSLSFEDMAFNKKCSYCYVKDEKLQRD